MPRVLVFSDPHFSRSEPECRAPSYPLEILDKLHECARIARERNAAIATTGDLLHRKGRVTFNEANDLLSVFSTWRQLGLEVMGVFGNHDIAGTGLDSMDSRAAGALYHAKAIRLLDFDPWFHEDETGKIYVTGTSYFHGCDSSDEGRIRMYGAEPPQDPEALHVHLSHGCLMLRGEFVDDFTSAESLVPLLAEAGRLPDVIVCGHLHFPEGVRYFDRPDGRGRVALCRFGSIGRVSRDDLERIPEAMFLSSQGREYEIEGIPVGKPPKLSGLVEGDPRDPAEHSARIAEFAARFREQAEIISFEDNGKLLRDIAEKLGYGEQVALRAIREVEARSG